MDSQLASDAVPPVVPEDSAAATDVDGRAAAVTVEGLHVQYRTRLQRQTVRTLANRSRRRERRKQVVEAIKDVSFEVPAGTVTGVIGRNGAGKSTLLRTIAGILPPTAGRITVRGEVSALLSLGVGFNRELSGRDNILIGGLAAGLDLQEIQDATPAIIEFAELGRFIDYPVRTYSSGMSSRLAFAVSSIIRPDILLLDEALGGGDTKFKEKCVERIDELCGQGRTVVLVSHGLGRIATMATSCIWLHEGTLMADGEPDEVISAYLRFCRIERSGLDELDALGDIDGEY